MKNLPLLTNREFKIISERVEEAKKCAKENRITYTMEIAAHGYGPFCPTDLGCTRCDELFPREGCPCNVYSAKTLIRMVNRLLQKYRDNFNE